MFALVALHSAAAAQSGTGLTGQYYDAATFSTLKTTRTDATVNFDWGTGIPSGTTITNADTFSVVWTGQVEPEFAELYTFYVTADDGVRLWVNDQLVVARTFAATAPEVRGQVTLKAGERVNLRLEYIEQTGNASVKLEWSSASRARETIPTARLYPARVDKAGGALLKEHWSGIAGGTITSLISNANYPNKPSGRELITSFECLAQDWADSYGTRVTGYLVAPMTGSYTFAVSGDDVVQLYLSTDATSANKALIASTTSATGFRVWNAQPSQQSTARTLTQGQRYYVELLHKENTGADHWSAAWMRPGDASFSVVPGSALVQPGLTTAQPTEANLLNTLAQEHPRIFATTESFAKLRAAWQNPTASQPKTWAQNAITSANTILTQDPVAYSQDVRGTILSQARTVVDRMYKLGVAWQMTNDSQYAERAWTELSVVAAFTDWHPAHFLDTAEMTHGCAIGYDWFYPYWTQARRDTIRNAIISKGLNAGLSQYTSNVGWSQSGGNNWNMVCNGGLTMGALAVGMENETLSENILNRALNSTRPVWKHFTADNGAWYEGPGYWGYTTEYGIRMFAALEWVLGSDFGISSAQNVSEAGFAPIHALGTSNVIFNFADAGAGGASRGPVFQWFARRYGRPVFAWWENQGSGGALDGLWYEESAASLTSTVVPPDAAFHGDAGTNFIPQDMVTMRGRWSDSRATFVASKGGEMGAAHGNLDAGTFVLDALGKRWFHDLGGDNYALAGYFSDTPSTGVDRWDYYRMRPEGQNTLTINPSANADMVLNAVAPLLAYQSEAGGSGSFAIHDLTSVYSGMTRVWRGTRLMGARNQVLVQDEIQAATGKAVWWFAHYTHPTTTVVIDPEGTSATMTQGVERLWCKIVSGGGTFQIMDAVPLPTSPNPAGQNANSGFKKLAINLTGVTNTTLALWFVPLAAGQVAPTTLPTITPLNTWNLATSNDAPNAGNGNATGNGENPVDIDLRNYVTDDSTPSAQMLFSVSGAQNGTITLLADGHTARFVPNPGYTGVPSFNFTVTDTTPDSRAVLAYDFDLPDGAAATIVPDVSENLRDGTIDLSGAATATFVPDHPATLGSQGARSLDLVENTTTAARVQRTLTAAELDWNASDWSVAGWFKRRDTANNDIIFHLGTGDGFGGDNDVYLNCPPGLTTVRLQRFSGAVTEVDLPQTGITTGVWHHFAVVRSGSVISLYVNGQLAGTDNTFALTLSQASPLIFGGHASTNNVDRWFDGQLDELAVFAAALSPAEVEMLANGKTVRHFGGLSATGTITLSAAPVTYVWNNPTAGTALAWSNGGNWLGGTAPTGTRGAAVQFFTGQTLAGGTVTSVDDVAGSFVMNNLTLAGTTSVAGTTATISGGSVSLLNNGTLNPSVTISATNGSGLTYEVATPITLGAPTTIGGTGTATVRFAGAIDGPGDLIKASSGTLTLTGTNTYTGDTIISTGTLQIGRDDATGTLGSGDVIDNAQLRFDRTGTLVVPNNISGTGNLYIDCPLGAGTIVLTGTNTFDGDVTVNSGALRITNSFALGDSTKTVRLSNGTAGAPQLRLDGTADAIELPATLSFLTSSSTGAIINEAGNNLISGNITLTGGGGDTRITVSAGSLTLDGAIAPNTTGRNLQLSGTGTGIITGVVSNGGTTYQLNVFKNDGGVWLLSGANSYSGTTTINAGILFLGHPNALGNGGTGIGNTMGGTSVIAGATLDLNGQSGINEVLTIRGTGVGGAGGLTNSSSTPASVAAGVVSSIAVTAGGTHSTVPDVMLTGSGDGATATATLGVTAASFTIAGGTTVYSTAPNVTISGGGGTGATATANLSAGVVSSITITNAGTGFTSAPNIAFSGGTVTTAGTNPTGAGNATNFIVAGITVTNPGAGYTTAPTVAFSSGTGTAATANLSAVILGAATTIGGAGDTVIHPGITGSFALTKAGIGIVTLNGASTYNGGTTISAGTLVVNGTLASGGTATVAAAATLAGNGSIATNTTVNGALRPGDELGTLTFSGSLSFGAASRLAWDLADNTVTGPGMAFDRVNAGGVTATTGAAIDVVLDRSGSAVDLADPFWSQSRTWPVISHSSRTGTFTLGNVSTDMVGRSANWFGTFSLQHTVSAVNLVWTPAAPWQQWRAVNFGANWNVTAIAGPNVITAGDGLTNLLKYALGLPVAVPSTPAIVLGNSGPNWTFTYQRPANRSDTTYSVQVRPDLSSGTWTTSGVTHTRVGTGDPETWLATHPVGPGRLFFRLFVTQP